MRRVINLLPAEVPDVHPKIALQQTLPTVFTYPDPGRKLPGHNVDSLGGIFTCIQGIGRIQDLLRQRRLTSARLSHYQELRFSKVVDASAAFLYPLTFDGIEALRHNLRVRYKERLWQVWPKLQASKLVQAKYIIRNLLDRTFLKVEHLK